MAASKTAWKKAKVHPDITLPSGTVISIRIPNLAALAKTGQLPNELLRIAIPEVAGPEPEPTTETEAQETLDRLAKFQSWITAYSVVEPKITEEDIDDLPTEDVEMIVAIATRQRVVDEVGHHIGGLEASAEWRQFRGLPPLQSNLLDE